MPAASYIARSSAAGLNAPSAPRLRVHSMWTAPGMAPPRLARTLAPQYSPSLRVSRIATSARPSRSCTSRQVASRAASRPGCQRPATGGAAAVVTGWPPRSHAPNPPSSSRAAGWPNSSRNQNARAARMPDRSSYTTTGRSASTPRAASRCAMIQRKASSGAGSVSTRLTPNRSRCAAPGIWPAANASVGRRSITTVAGAVVSGDHSAGVPPATPSRPASSAGSISRSGQAYPFGFSTLAFPSAVTIRSTSR